MRNKDELVRKNLWISLKSFIGQRKHYEELNLEIEKAEQQLSIYEKLLKTEISEDKKINFKDELELYTILDTLIMEQFNRTGNTNYAGIDLSSLRRKLYFSFENVRKYIDLKNEISNLKKEISTILTENINFEYFGDYEDYDNACYGGHYIVRFEDELLCLKCGATTKDFSMKKEDIDFLTIAAEKQGMLLKEVTKEDIPLLYVLKSEKDYQKSQRKPLSEVDENEYLAVAEEYWLIDESEISDIRREIRKAHKLDSRNLEGLPKVSNPQYLTDEQAKQKLLEIDKQIEEVKKSNSKFKKLILEECNAAKYEILILNGAHIPNLMKETKNQNDKTALVKAYYNLSNASFRVNSGYFKPDNRNWEALAYDCRTANPEINQRILEMKVKKNKQ